MSLIERDCQTMVEMMETLVPGFNDGDRHQEKAAARKVVIYSLRMLGYTTIAIGKVMGKDHSTVVYSTKYVKEVLSYPKTDPTLMHILNNFNKLYQQS